MKIIYVLIIILCDLAILGQTNTLENNAVHWPNEKHVRSIYNPLTKTINAAYDYSNLWDLDGDTKKDSVLFLGNNGAHVYFYLRIVLSSTGSRQDFPYINLDMPYFETIDKLKKIGKNQSIQFVVHDFNSDGIVEMYLNFNNSFSSIPKDWVKKGVTSKNVLLDFSGRKLSVKDY